MTPLERMQRAVRPPTTLTRVQSAAAAASHCVGGAAEAAFLAFIDALEDEILKEEIEANKGQGR